MSSEEHTRHTLADEETKPTVHVDELRQLVTAVRGVTQQLLPNVLVEVKASNRLATRNQLVLRVLGIFIALLLLLMGGCIVALWHLTIEMRVTQLELDVATDQLDEMRRSQEKATDAVG